MISPPLPKRRIFSFYNSVSSVSNTYTEIATEILQIPKRIPDFNKYLQLFTQWKEKEKTKQITLFYYFDYLYKYLIVLIINH